ncbi:MAG TPA: T9SS type A sorting domain-containing protein, partial [Chitinophagaceae bacterium]|nr:T9SS type A sorting domain-containing protein [Chitinophagaceae bacterium]
ALDVRGGIHVFPNPAVNTCTIRSREPIKYITVYNTEGRVVKTIDCVNRYQYEMNMSGWAKGMYFIVIQGDNGILAKKKILKAE